MSLSDKIARALVILCIIVLAPVAIISKSHFDSYVFGIITGFLATLAGLWKRLML